MAKKIYIIEGSAVGFYKEFSVFSVEADNEEQARQIILESPMDYLDDVYDIEHIDTDKLSVELNDEFEIEE